MSTAQQERATFPELIGTIGRSYLPIAFVARLPYAMTVVGVLTMVAWSRGSITLGGLCSAVAGIAGALAGPVIGGAADRFGQRGVVLSAGLGNGVALLLLAALTAGPTSDVVVVGAAALAGATTPQIGPLSRSRLVAVIAHRPADGQRRRLLDGTMAYESAADETAFVLGPVLVGLLAAGAGPLIPIVCAAALSVVFVTAFAVHASGTIAATGGYAASGTRAPLRSLAAPGLLLTVLGTVGTGAFFGSTLTSLTAFMADRGADGTAGIAYGAMGIGSAVVALSVVLLPARFGPGARWFVFALVVLAGGVGFGVVESVPLVVTALLLAGTGIGPTLVTQFGLGAERSPAGRSATTMTLLGSGVIVGQALAAAAVGALADHAGTAAAMWAPAAAALIIVLAATLDLLRRNGGQQRDAPDARDALAPRPTAVLESPVCEHRGPSCGTPTPNCTGNATS